MKPSLLFRFASVLIVLFAAGHTLGFRQVDPAWQAGSVVEAMKSVHFQVQGFSRSYWGFYVGFGLFVTVFELFVAFLVWQLGSVSQQLPGFAKRISWALTLSFAAAAVLSWRYFFGTPVVFSLAISGCLLAATLSVRSADARG